MVRMGTVDAAFLKSGQSPGLEIWRIEKMKVVLQNPVTYGEFFIGDSYIVLHTKKNSKSGKLEWNIHFWLGNETSQDEQGVAAYKTVELDDFLGGAPVQHREVQDHESKLFLSYFTKGIRYLTGGIESGFRKVEKGHYQKRLFHIKGKKNVRVTQVECSCRSLNQGDVFLLDCGLVLHLWNGPLSSTFERMKGYQVAKTIRDDERGGKAEIRIIDARWNTDIQFFADLGSKTDIAESSTAGDDLEFERKIYSEIKLYRVSDSSGKMEIVEKSKKPFHQSDLDSNDCFILDAGASGIFVWVGLKCSHDEKKSAWKYASDFLDIRGYPNWTSITRVVEGGETPVFKQYFTSWVDVNDQKGLGNIYNVGSIAEIQDEANIDYCQLHERKQSVDDADLITDILKIRVWKVRNGDVEILPERPYAELSSTSCFVILVSFKSNDKINTIGYYWQGIRSNIDDRSASAIYTKRICEQESTGSTRQIRIEQGREPETFLRIFKGRIIIKMNDDHLTYRDNIMYHIRGTNTDNTKAVEVEFSSKSLNSFDVFLIKTNDHVYIWVGKISIEAEFHATIDLASYVSPNSPVKIVPEGEESLEFWQVLGGKESYAKSMIKQSPVLNNQTPVRLFVCSNTTGMFKVTEICPFTQQDLLEDDVMLLDTFDEIYVWVGKGANRLERQKALETAIFRYLLESRYEVPIPRGVHSEPINYLKSDPTGRTEDDTRLIQIKQGYEPSTFTSHFHGWDHSRWRSGLYKKEAFDQPAETGHISTVQEELEKLHQNYSYQQLVQKRLPEGVDPIYKEKYLTENEFYQIFGVSKETFYKKPKWKQLELKKQVGLF